MTQLILVYGNCQAGVYAELLSAIVGSSYDVRHLMSFVHPTEAPVALAADELASCHLVFDQVDSLHPMPETIASALPKGVPTVRFPPLDFNLLWPHNFVDPRNVSEPPEFPFGRFPYGDRIVVELLNEGLAGAALWDAYRERSVSRMPDLHRLLRHEQARLAARDHRADVKVGALILREFTKRNLFWTINHPTGWLLEQVFAELLSRARPELGLLPHEPSKLAQKYFDGYEPFGHHHCPIHPEVGRILELSWWAPDRRYQYLDGTAMTFEETMRRYIDFR